MQNFCQIYSKKTKKISAFALIFCLIYGLTPAAEGISAKLRGKIALGVILSGVAYTTHTLIKRDRQAAKALRHHLGVPERIVQFERGFDLWRIEHYADRHYIFRNNRLLTKTNFSTPPGRGRTFKPHLPRCKGNYGFHYEVPQSSVTCQGWRVGSLEKLGWKNGKMEDWIPILPLFQSSIPVPSKFLPVLIDMPVSRSPKWSQPYLLDSRRVPQFVSSDPHQLATERSLDPQLWLSH